MSQEIFLETTVQLYRIFGKDVVRERIARRTSGKRLSTSTYVLGEFVRTRLVPFVAVYAAISLPENKELGDIFAYLSDAYGGKAKHYLAILGLLTRRKKKIAKEKLICKAKRYISWQLMACFMEDIKIPLLNPTDCHIAKGKPIFRDGVFEIVPLPRCRKVDVQCNIVDFLKKHKDELSRIVKALEGKALYEKMKEAVAEVLRDWEKARGRICKDLIGDVIISLECPPGSILYTGDRVFEILLPAIDKRAPMKEQNR